MSISSNQEKPFDKKFPKSCSWIRVIGTDTKNDRKEEKIIGVGKKVKEFKDTENRLNVFEHSQSKIGKE